MKKLTKNNVRKVLAVALTVIVGVVTMIPDSAIRTNADESDAAAAVEATEDVTSLTEYTISEDALAAADETLYASCTMQITGMMAVLAQAADYAR